MSHKCFISFKTEDLAFKNKIQTDLNIDMIDKSLNEPINSDDEDYIMQVIRQDYLKDSSITITLIGEHSSENDYIENQQFIKRELQASLYGTPNGILGIVLPSMYDKIYKGSYTCEKCGNKHNAVVINDNTTIKEFNVNYYIEKHDGCAWFPEDRYCILTKWDDFLKSPEAYIDMAFDKRSKPVVDRIRVFPK